MTNGHVRDPERIAPDEATRLQGRRMADGAQAASRWPFLPLADQVVTAERRARKGRDPAAGLPANVTPISGARPHATSAADWFLGGPAPAPHPEASAAPRAPGKSPVT